MALIHNNHVRQISDLALFSNSSTTNVLSFTFELIFPLSKEKLQLSSDHPTENGRLKPLVFSVDFTALT